MIKPRFIHDGPNGSIYSVEYQPADPGKVKGVVVWAPPLFDFGLRAYRVFFNCFRSMSNAGYHVFYFDYAGSGNSGGSFGLSSFETMVADMNHVLGYVKKKLPAQRIILAGFQVGALVSLSLASQHKKYSSLLVEPVLDGRKFLHKFLRSHLSSQLTLYNKILQDRNQLIEIIYSEGMLHVEGYEISNDFWNSFMKVSLEGLVAERDALLQIVLLKNNPKLPPLVDKSNRNGSNIEFAIVKKEFYWESWRNYIPKSAALEKAIIALLNNQKVTFS